MPRVREVIFTMGVKGAVPRGGFMRAKEIDQEAHRIFGPRRTDPTTLNNTLCLLRYLTERGRVEKHDGGRGRRDITWRLSRSGMGYFRWLYNLYKKTGEI